MKGKLLRMGRSGISFLLAFCLLASMFTGVAFASESQKTIKYVSIGDSMTNGYGFDGYNQDMHTIDRDKVHLTPDVYNFFDGTGVYGEGSYANQFAEHLEKYGEVEHTKMALSAFRPEDLLFLIDDSIDKHDQSKLPLKDGYFNNSWGYVWDACEDYDAKNPDESYKAYFDGYVWGHEPGTSCGASGYVAYHLQMRNFWTSAYPTTEKLYQQYETQFAELKTYFQESLIDADVISLALGNAAFDAYFMDRLFMIWGDEFGQSQTWKGRNEITIADVKAQLCKTDAEKAMVDKLYEAMQTIVAEKISAEDYSAMKMDRVCQLMTYVTFSYMYSYKQVIEWIGAKNPDAEVMIVGLLNSHHGITLAQDGEVLMDMGEGMGAIYDIMNTYVAGVAADFMEKNEAFEGEFYFVEQPENPEMIATVIDELDKANWGLIDCGKADCEYCLNGLDCPNGRLDGEIVRVKTIPVFTSFFAKGLGYWYPGAQYAGGMASSDQELLNAIQGAIDNDLTAVDFYNAVTGGTFTSNDFNNANVGPLGAIVANVLYLACEKAMIKALESGELEVDALVGYADGSMKELLNTVDKTILPTNNVGTDKQAGWATVNVPTHDKDGNKITLKYIYDYFYEFYTSEEMLPMLRFFAINKVGNGIAAHPTPSNHDRLAANMIAAYENGYTVQDKCKDTPAPIVANEIYVALTEQGLLTLDQTMEIMDCVAGAITDGMNTTAIMDEVYVILFYADITDAQRNEIVGIVYSILNDKYELAANNANIQAVENIATYLYGNKYIDDEQAFMIVNFIYWTVSDGIQDGDIMEIVKFVYMVVFDGMRATMFAEIDLPEIPEGLTASKKMEILLTVYGEFKAANPEIVEENPELKVVEDLHTALTKKDAEGDSLLNDEQMFAIFDTAIKSLVIEEKPAEEAIKDITAEVNTQIATLPAEKKLAVLEAVGKAAEDLGKIEGGSDLIPGGSVGGVSDSMAMIAEFTKYFAIVKEIVENLRAEGLFTDYADEKFNALTSGLIDKLMNNEEIDPMAIAKDVYEMLFEQPGFEIVDDIKIVEIIYTTLEDNGIISKEIINDAIADAIDELKAIVPGYYAEAYAYAVESGYIEIAVDAIDTAIAAIKSIDLSNTNITAETKANIATELAAVVATLAEMKAALNNVTTMDALITAIKGLEDDLYIHLDNLKAIAKTAGDDVYELAYLIPDDIVNNEVILAINLAVQNTFNKIYGYMIQKINDAYGLNLNANVSVKDIIAAIGARLKYIFGGDVEISEDTFYLAIVNGEEAYADLLAAALGLTEDQYKKVTTEELTAEDLAKATLISVGYNTDSVITFTANQVLGVANGYVQYADAFIKAVDAKMNANFPNVMNMIDIDIYDTVMDLVKAEAGEYLAMVEGKEAVEIDWTALVGDKYVAYVEAAKAELRAALLDAGIPESYSFTLDIAGIAAELIAEKSDGLVDLNTEKLIAALGEHAVFTLEIPVVDLAVYAAESAMYEFVKYNKEYSETVLAINAINPDATVALLGNYNRYSLDYTIVTDAVTFTLNDVLAKVGIENITMPAEIKAAIAKFAAVGVYEINLEISEYVDDALELYNKAMDFVVNFEIPACEEAELLIAELVKISNECVASVATKDVYTIKIPVTELVNLVVEQGYKIDELINDSLNIEITIEGKTIEANDVLDLLANLSSIHPFIYSVVFENMFYVDISDALEGGEVYIAEAIYAALNVSYKETGLWGDANDDGIVNTTDARLVLQFYTSEGTAKINTAVCDVNGDGIINTTDARLILQHYTSGGTMRFPVEE